MIARILMSLLLLLPFTGQLEAVPLINRIQNVFSKEPPPPPPSIKILIANDHDGVILEVKGKYKIYDARDMSFIGTRYQGKRRFLQATHEGIIWGEEFPGIHQIAIIPDEPTTNIIVDGVEFGGSIFVYDLGGTISIVNHLDVEKYLGLTLPSQFQLQLPEEVLNAVAITARTNAYYKAQNSKSPYYDVEASKVNYHGSILGKRSPAIEKAVKDTQYMILNQIGKDKWLVTPFQAYWRPQNGGAIISQADYSKITLEEATQLAKRGQDASQILEAAFPDSSIELVHYTP